MRSDKNLKWLQGLNVDIVVGDCTRRKDLDAALTGVRKVIHVAGITWATRARDFFLHNSEATGCLVDACIASGQVERLILVSSQAAAGPGTREHPRTEAMAAHPITVYGRSKLEAESRCLQAADRLSVIILRPSAVYGPRDTAFLPYFRLVKRGFLLEFGSGPRELSLCYVDDLVTVIVKVIDSHLASGSVYFVADSEPYVWNQVESATCTQMGVVAKRIVVPGMALKTAGVIGQVFGLLSGRPMMLNRARVAELLEKNWVCDSAAIRRDLGFASGMNLENGLQKAVRWYEQNNWL